MIEEVGKSILYFAPLPILLVGLTFVVLTDNFIRKEHKSVMLIITAMIFSMIVQNLSEYFLSVPGQSVMLRKLVSMYGYIMRPIIIVMCFYLVGKKDKLFYFAWTLVLINTLIYLTALFSRVAFTISSDNHFLRGPLGFTCHIISAILLLHLLYLSIKECYKVRKAEAVIPIFNLVIIVVGIILDSAVSLDMTVSCLTIGMVIACVFYYIWLHLRFVREHENALMAEQRMKIMVSQIQPHFMYNTLSTIQALCRIDPNKAFSVTEKFGTYLRQNIDSLSQPELIPIEKELEHTQLYADIEMIRFPNVKVEYDIKDKDFRLPALTIQPMVENAIRHGIRIRDEGVVTVTTRKKGEYHEVVIKDNGKGFYLEDMKKQTGSHIGLSNVQERIETMCGGTLTVDSVIDKGTTVIMRIPDNRHRSSFSLLNK